MAEDILLRWRTDISALRSDFTEVEQRINRLTNLIDRLGADDTRAASLLGMDEATSHAARLINQLEQIQALRTRLVRGGGVGINPPTELRGLFGRSTGAVGLRDLEEASARLQSQLRSLRNGLQQIGEVHQLNRPVEAFNQMAAAARRAQREAVAVGDSVQARKLFELFGQGDLSRVDPSRRGGRAGLLGVDFAKEIRQADELLATVIDLQRVLNQMRAGPGELIGLGRVGRNRQFAPEADTAIGDLLGGGQHGRAAIEEALADTQDELIGTQGRLEALTITGTQAGQAISRAFGEVPAVMNTVTGVTQRMNDILSGRSVNQVVAERTRLLEQQRDTLITTQAQLRQQALQGSLGRRDEAKLSQQLAQLAQQEADAQRRVLSIEQQRAALVGQIRSSREAAVQQAFREARSAAAEGRPATFQGANLAPEDLARIQRYIDLTNQATAARQRLAQIIEQARAPRARATELENLTGVAPALAQTEVALAGINGELQKLGSDDALGALREQLGPKFVRQFEQLARIQDRLARGSRTSKFTGEEIALTAREMGNLQRGAETLVRSMERQLQAANLDIPQALNLQGVQEALQSQLPPLERAMIGAFSDMGQRFRATLQFALSGAFIFGLQQLAREAFETAIEVERAFADIETAIRIEEGLGGAALTREVEAIRREVLLVADEFNVLPTVANDAAFRMVARFEDTGNAVQALRAQLLATKVSTIEQSEVLRALTATAETFAGAVFEANNELSLQERLLEHETQSAELYGSALDVATRIQQKFGIEVEDVLEGTARASEVFRQTGFTFEETAGIIAATTLRLGQTGAANAERLNRAFGAIAQPQVIEELVSFASQSENLQLTYADFGESVANALFKIQAQVERLDPGELERLIAILGQRRETDVIAAFLGTADLQNSIIGDAANAAGAAEERFAILSRTTSELIESLKVQFQELAQNLERLGALDPLKVLLNTLDNVLTVVNAISKGIKSLFDLLNSIQIGDTGLGDLAVQLSSLVLSIAALKRLAQAGVQIASYFGALELASRVGGVLTAGGAVQGGLAAGGLLGSPTNQVALQRASSRVAQAFGKVGVAAGSLVGAFLSPVRTLRNLFSGLGDYARSVGAVIAQIRAEISARAASAILARTERGGRLAQRVGGFLTTQRPGPGGTVVPALSGAAGLAVGAVGALALAVGGLVQRSNDARRAQEQYAEALQSNTRAAERRIREEDLTGGAARAERLQAELDAFETVDPVSGISAFLGELFLDMRVGLDDSLRDFANDPTVREQAMRAFDEANFVEQIGLSFRQFLAGQTFRFGLEGVDVAVLDPTTEQSIEQQMRDLSEQIIQAEVQGFQEAIAKIDPRTITSEQQQAIDNALRLAADLNALLARTDASPEEIAAQAARVRLGMDAAMDVTGQTLEALEGSLTELQNRISNLQFNAKLGRVSPAQLRDELGGALNEARNQLAQQTTDEGRASAQEQVNSILEDLIAAERAAIDRQLKGIGLIQDTDQRLAAEVKVLESRLTELDQFNMEGSEEWIEIQIRLAEIAIEQTERQRERILQASREAVSLARNADVQLDLMKDLLQRLIGAWGIAIVNLNFELAREIMSEIKRLQADIEGTEQEQGAIRAVANIRLAGPILSRLQGIKAEIEGINQQINSGTLSSAEVLEATVRLQELLAARAQEQARAAAAFVRLSAGSRNELKLLRAELTILANELELTGKLYGDTSAEYLELKLRHQQAKDAIIDAQLELRDLNRRLADTVDVTDPFIQAQLDLATILDKLNQKGLGELEKARLELERRQAQANAVREFYSDRLFQLQFDFETGAIGEEAYVSALRKLQETVDTTTRQGKEIWLEIESLIQGLEDDVQSLQFNIPSQIRLPTIFEIRRALAADQMGVNYMDNRVVSVSVDVRGIDDLNEVLQAIDDAFSDAASLQFRRTAPGGVTTYGGGF